MATLLQLGPADHGRPLSLEEFTSGDFAEGYQYELIGGRLYVSPQPNAPEGLVERWIFLKLQHYADDHPGVINFVYGKTRVFVPGTTKVTAPEPDVAAYRDFPLHLPKRQVRWEDVSPVLVVEVLSIEDPDKDLVRNADLYLRVPSIKEYWVIDTRVDPDLPTMRVHRRHGRRWRVRNLAAGASYSTRLLPDFELTLDTRG
jgi:Uma2 family endonuclease